MFYPSSDVLQDLTERTKLIAQKCSNQLRNNAETQSTDANISVKCQDTPAKSISTSHQTCNHSNKFNVGQDKCRLNCLCACGKKNLASLNRLIKNRCSFMSNGTFNPFSFAQTSSNTLPRRKPKKSTTKWYVKVNC